MNRITPEQVINAYLKTGLLPTLGKHYVVDGDKLWGASSICAMYYAEFGKQGRPHEMYSRYGENYIHSFDCGFEGWNSDITDYQAYKDGQSARFACVDNGLELVVFRISPELVVDAFKKTGLIPSRKYYMNGKYADALVAVYCAYHSNPIPISYRVIDEYFRYYCGVDYIESFCAGWDGKHHGYYVMGNDATFDGYADGRAAWDAVKQAGLIRKRVIKT